MAGAAHAADGAPVRCIDGQMVIVALTPAVAKLARAARTIKMAASGPRPAGRARKLTPSGGSRETLAATMGLPHQHPAANTCSLPNREGGKGGR